jgi:hypothetical protein
MSWMKARRSGTWRCITRDLGVTKREGDEVRSGAERVGFPTL